MQIILSYLIKLILISAVLYGYYLLMLRNKKFHQYNRFYLLSVIFLPLILPFLPFDFTVGSGNGSVPVIIKRDMVMETIVVNLHPEFWNAEKILWFAYLTVAGLLSLLFLASLYRIHTIKRKGNTYLYRGGLIVETTVKGTPFSFFRYIFWNPEINIETSGGQQMFTHELTHVRQLHSLDKLLVNLVQIVFWFNPVFWLVKREINIVHEFLADRESIKNNDVHSFSKITLQAAYPGFTWPATNSFFYSPIKRRLAMMLKDKKQKVSYFGRLMTLPLAALIFMFFSNKAKETNVGTDTYQPIQTESAVSLPDTLPGNDKVFTRVEIEAQFRGGPAAWQKYLVKVLKENIAKFTAKDYGTCVLKFIVRKDGSVSNVTATTMQGTELARVGIDAIKNGPKWIPAQQNGKYVNAYRLQPITLINPKKDSAMTENLSEEKNFVHPPTDRIFIQTEKQAEFPGGQKAWDKYITKVILKHLNELNSRDYGTCKIRFVVNANGKVSDIQALNMKGTKLAEIVINAVRKGPEWIPASQNDHKVTAYREVDVTWKYVPPRIIKDSVIKPAKS